MLALVPDAVLLEAKAGPFNPNAAKELAPWAPEERTQEGQAFLSAIKAKTGLEAVLKWVEWLKPT